MKQHPIFHFSHSTFHFPILCQGILGVFLLIILSACSGGKQYSAMLDRADSLMTGQPDSAYALLCAIDSADLQRQRKSVRMRFELLRAEAQNKLYIPFRTDSVLRKVADYYNRHGSSNDRLRSRYALGCAYRDLHEAPAALLTWEDAIAAADTTASDCDYATLYRVYGQMADIYFRQYLPEKELEARGHYCKYALQAGDTLNYVQGLIKRNDAYLSLGDTAAIFANIKNAQEFCEKHGLDAEKTISSLMAIRLTLDKNDFQRAGEMMQDFEQKSGLFDDNGNIASGREIYYYDKGRYFAGIGLLDSAENQFRKLLSFEDCRIDACHGLLFLFQYQQRTDSILKYTLVYEQALASYLTDTKTASFAQAEGMYNYSRQERIAQKQELQYWLTLAIIIPLAFAAAIFVAWLFYKKRSEKRKLLAQYKKTLEELSEAKRISQLLRQALSKKEVTKELLDEKEEQVQQLKAVVSALQKRIGASKNTLLHQQLSEAEIIQRFHEIANPFTFKGKGLKGTMARAATQEEWADLEDSLMAIHPQFFLYLQKHKLSDLKTKVCILSYLGFNNTEIATLSGAYQGSITNARTAIARDLFNLKSARDLNRHLNELDMSE